jgi:hypothetical protein
VYWHTSTCSLLVGPCSSDLEYFGRVTLAGLLSRALVHFGEKEGATMIHICSVWRGYALDLTLILLPTTYGGPIYLSRYFQGIWRLPPSGPKY